MVGRRGLAKRLLFVTPKSISTCYYDLTVCIDTNWDSHRTSGGCCGRQKDATLLFVW